jgi:hypothetical protein
MSLIDRIPADYQRPKCPHGHGTLAFIHENPGGSRYACMPCEFGPGYVTGEGLPITNSEASWIIRHGITTPESRKESRHA